MRVKKRTDREARPMGKIHKQTSGTKIPTSRFSQCGTREEWARGIERFWSGKLRPEMKKIREVSHLNPNNSGRFS
jgi:hypothetical protein